jgi:hypothetical protein
MFEMQTALRQKKKILVYPLYLYYVVLIATSGAADKDCHID